jgi:hypothetical protein
LSKRDIEREARHIRATSTAVAKETAEEQLRALKQETRNAETFGAAATCEACAKLPEGSLCEKHLREALGF